MQLFTIDSQEEKNIKMTVYKIKRLYQSIGQIIKEKIKKQKEKKNYNPQNKILAIPISNQNKKEVKNKSTYKLLSFRISKYSTVKLDYLPKNIEFYDPYIILTYRQSSKAAAPMDRADIMDKSVDNSQYIGEDPSFATAREGVYLGEDGEDNETSINNQYYSK